MTDSMTADSIDESPSSWVPMALVAMGQTLTTLNISALPVLIGAMVDEFSIAPTTVASAIVVYSIAVSGFIMLGAKLGQKYGSTTIFRWSVLLLLIAAAMTASSTSFRWLLVAQALSGLGAAMLLPSLVVLITDNYSGHQQAKAIGLLGAVQAAATVATILIAGLVGTHLGWRYSFGLIVPFATLTWLLSHRLKPSEKQPDLKIDRIGAALAAFAIALISLGFNFINDWGPLRAYATAPSGPLGISPALLMIVIGIVGMQLFIVWVQHRKKVNKAPLLAIEVIESRPERMAVLALMAIVAIGSALNFMIPLYIQMVQGQSSFATAMALVPYQLSILVAAILVIGLYRRFSPRQLARYSFMLAALALVVLAFVINNQWNDGLVVLSLILIGLAQGALVTLLFNVLISAAPRRLSGDVGALRGAARNLANGLGAAFAGALVVGLLSASITYEIQDHPEIPPNFINQINIDRVTFVSNVQLQDFLAGTTASPNQVREAININAEARLYSLKMALLFLAAIAALMVLPVRRLPGFSRSSKRSKQDNASSAP
jgi:predicted MFS family arabinose efflux permease